MMVLWLTWGIPMQADDEAGLLVEYGAEKRLSRQWSVGVEGDFRLRNNFKTVERFSIGAAANYQFNRWLKADASYILLIQNTCEDVELDDNGSVETWIPGSWGLRHRVHVSLTGSYRFENNICIALRERWQYTYQPTTTVRQWDADEGLWEDVEREGKGKHQLRSRLQISYDSKGTLLVPYASVELYNNMKIDKVRYTAGTQIRLGTKHTLDVFYRYQDIRHQDCVSDSDMHYIGIGYRLKI